jgi:hypothetical protein
MGIQFVERQIVRYLQVVVAVHFLVILLLFQQLKAIQLLFYMQPDILAEIVLLPGNSVVIIGGLICFVVIATVS